MSKAAGLRIGFAPHTNIHSNFVLPVSKRFWHYCFWLKIRIFTFLNFIFS